MFCHIYSRCTSAVPDVRISRVLFTVLTVTVSTYKETLRLFSSGVEKAVQWNGTENMSSSVTTFGGTVTSGIQELSALLPLLGTQECENHIGSALDAGYTYAAATILSIFGSLGIVKAGIAVLVASVSVQKLKLSFRSFPKITLSPSGELVIGAKVLRDAGFNLPGSVAPRIGIDPIGKSSLPFGPRPVPSGNQRHTAETMLLENLEEKHIDDPERVSVTRKSHRWNIGMIVTTTIAAILSGTPYIHFFANLNYLPESLHYLWVFPILRSLGSCVTATSIQFVLEHRIIRILKDRLTFMVVDQRHSDVIHNVSTGGGSNEVNAPTIKWDGSLPAEECLENLKMHLLQIEKGTPSDPEKQECSSENRAPDLIGGVDKSPFFNIRATLDEQQKRHFGTRTYDISLSFVVAWICLLFGTLITVVGYIGCFTIVSNGSQSAGPLIWLGVELALSFARIQLWALNPTFDEDTQVIIDLALDTSPPHTVKHAVAPAGQVFDLMAEHDFLERITRYTGPLDRFNSPQNTVLYLTVFKTPEGNSSLSPTILDLGKCSAFTLHHNKVYDATVHPDVYTGEMKVTLRSEIAEDDLRLLKQYDLLKSLLKYTEFLTSSLQKPEPAQLTFDWKLSPKMLARRETPHYTPAKTSAEALEWYEGFRDSLELRCKWKKGLVDNWGRWITKGDKFRRRDVVDDCQYDLPNPSSEDNMCEAIQIDFQLVLEWIKREITLKKLSLKLEAILRAQIVKATRDRRNDRRNASYTRVAAWLFGEFKTSQGQRLHDEHERMNQRLVEVGENLFARYGVDAVPNIATQLLEKMRDFTIDAWPEWTRSSDFDPAKPTIVDDLDWEVVTLDQSAWSMAERSRTSHSKWLKDIVGDWRHQRDNETREMELTVQGIGQSNASDSATAFKSYPEASADLATVVFSRFGNLSDVSQNEKAFAAKLSSATVFDLQYCDSNVIEIVMQKPTTRSIIGVDLYLGNLDNSHLLHIDSSEHDTSYIHLKNRDRWLEQATQLAENASTVYFSPDSIGSNGQYVRSNASQTIAHVLLSVKSNARPKLRLVHRRRGQVSVSILHHETELCHIPVDCIPENAFGMLDAALGEFEAEAYELRLVVQGDEEGSYGLRAVAVIDL